MLSPAGDPQSCGQMLTGLLIELDDRNRCPIAEAIRHRGPHRLQHLLSRAVWDDQHLADIASAWAAGHLDDGDAVLIVDETADEKSSADCAGAARLGDYFAEVLLLDQGTDAARARAELGWSPSHPSLVDEFRHGSYRR